MDFTTSKRKKMLEKIRCSISAGMNHQLFLDIEKNVCIAEGSNSYGQLTNGTVTSFDFSKEMDFKNEILRLGRSKDLRIIQVATFASHNLFLMKDGSVYATGNNKHGSCGNSSLSDVCELSENSRVVFSKKNKKPIERKRKKRKRMKNSYDIFDSLVLDRNAEPNIVDIICGGEHSFFISEKGELYGVGDNSYTQLFMESEERHIQYPIKVEFKTSVDDYDGSRIAKITCGRFHSLILSRNGFLYSGGFNVKGQCGRGKPIDIRRAVKKGGRIQFPIIKKGFLGGSKIKYFDKKVSLICCGRMHSIVVTSDNCVYGFGENSYGQLGINNRTEQYFPKELETFQSINKKIIQISGGERHSIFLTNDYQVYCCGSNYTQQLGKKSSLFATTIPIKMDLSFLSPKNICIPKESRIFYLEAGYFHNLFISESGHIYQIGMETSIKLSYNDTDHFLRRKNIFAKESKLKKRKKTNITNPGNENDEENEEEENFSCFFKIPRIDFFVNLKQRMMEINEKSINDLNNESFRIGVKCIN